MLLFTLFQNFLLTIIIRSLLKEMITEIGLTERRHSLLKVTILEIMVESLGEAEKIVEMYHLLEEEILEKM